MAHPNEDDEIRCGTKHPDGYTCTEYEGHGSYDHVDEYAMVSWPVALHEIKWLRVGVYAWCKSSDRQSGEDGPPFIVRVIGVKTDTVICTSNLHPDGAGFVSGFGVNRDKLSRASHIEVIKSLVELAAAESACASRFNEQLKSMGATVIDVTGASLEAIGYHGGFGVTGGPDLGGSHPWGVTGYGPSRSVPIARCATREVAGVIARLLNEADGRRPEEKK